MPWVLLLYFYSIGFNMEVPVAVQHLFPLVDDRLIELLESLTEEQWQLPTLAGQWTVKDIAAHLLDGNIRAIAAADNHRPPAPPVIKSYDELVAYLNGLNAAWVAAMKRVSTQQLVQWLKATGSRYSSIMSDQHLFEKAPFPVSWAGEEESLNWFHIAREYTEKVHHQLQIRQAVNKEAALMSPELFQPFIATLMYGLPHALRFVPADDLTAVQVTITGEAGGCWFAAMHAGKWILHKDNTGHTKAEVVLAPSVAWKLFTKGIRPAEAATQAVCRGDKQLCDAVLNMVAVMA